MQGRHRLLRDVVIIDTAGRLHVDEDMMAEAEAIKAAVKPDQILMVVDAMTGQDVVNVVGGVRRARRLRRRHHVEDGRRCAAAARYRFAR